MHSRNRLEPVTSARRAFTGLLLALLHGSRANERTNKPVPFVSFFLGPRKARSRRHEVADLNDRTYGRRRYAFVAELRMPAVARFVIFKGLDLFSPRSLPALNLTRARKVALVGESGSDD